MISVLFRSAELRWGVCVILNLYPLNGYVRAISDFFFFLVMD